MNAGSKGEKKALQIYCVNGRACRDGSPRPSKNVPKREVKVWVQDAPKRNLSQLISKWGSSSILLTPVIERAGSGAWCTDDKICGKLDEGDMAWEPAESWDEGTRGMNGHQHHDR